VFSWASIELELAVKDLIRICLQDLTHMDAQVMFVVVHMLATSGRSLIPASWQ
jgi:hypothetical protein